MAVKRPNPGGLIPLVLLSVALLPCIGTGEEVQLPKVVSAAPVSDSATQAAAAQARRQELIVLAASLTAASAIDSIGGLTGEEKAFLRARYRILHPIE